MKPRKFLEKYQEVFSSFFNIFNRHRPGTAKGNDLDDLKALECQMESIMRKLADAQKQVLSLKRQSNRNQEENLTIVIEADPAHPPSAVRALLCQITAGIKTSVTVHSHSSLPDSSIRQGWLKPVESSVNRPDNQLNLTWIWKAGGPQPVLKFVNRPNRADLRGEASIARLLARLAESWTNDSLYEAFGTTLAAQIDELIDLTERPTDKAAIIRRLEQRLSRSDWLVGEGRGIKSLADVFLAAVLENHAIQNRQLKEWALRSS